MTTTDTNFAAFLIDRGYELTSPVDYSQPKWVYEFDMDEEKELAQLTIYRRQGFSNVCKITQNLIALAHEKTLQPWIAEKWPTLAMAERLTVTRTILPARDWSGEIYSDEAVKNRQWEGVL